MVSDAKYHGTKGKLYLTNKKIVFEYKKRGILFKGKYSAVNLPLEKISEVAIVGIGFFKKLTINMAKNAGLVGIPRYEFSVNNPETWKARIEVAKSTSMEKPKSTLMEKQVIIKEVIKIKCPYCGMLVESNLSQCPNCGAILK